MIILHYFRSETCNKAIWPEEHWAMSGDTHGYHNQGLRVAFSGQKTEAREAAQRSTIHRICPVTEWGSQWITNNLKIKTPCFRSQKNLLDCALRISDSADIMCKIKDMNWSMPSWSIWMYGAQVFCSSAFYSDAPGALYILYELVLWCCESLICTKNKVRASVLTTQAEI